MDTNTQQQTQMSLMTNGYADNLPADAREAMEHALNNPAAQLVMGVLSLVEKFIAWRGAVKNARILRGLSDEILADIGIERWQIEDASYDLSRGIHDVELQVPTGSATTKVVPFDEHGENTKSSKQPELPLAA